MTDRGVLPIEEQAKLAGIENLPKSLRDLAEAHGLRLVLRLIQEFGGLGVRVPKVRGKDTELVRQLGEADANLVISMCAGEKIEVPRSALNQQSKNDRILSLAARHWRHTDIAREVGCTDRWVRWVIANNGSKPDKRQIDMFG